MVIAPLDANTMAKIANGLCDNLLVSAVIVKKIGQLIGAQHTAKLLGHTCLSLKAQFCYAFASMS